MKAVRNANDLATMSVPAKYRAIGDFHEYYSGARLAPYLTIFIGGNHEASAHMLSLPHGGWVAPRIYYMGFSSVVRFGGLRIAGLSGIWKGYNYNRPHDERLPFSADDVKSAYHVREWDVRKLLQVRGQVDVGLSHDWPRGVEWKGNWKDLFMKKRGFEEDARTGRLGSVAAERVMQRLRPKWWFSAHLHVKFAAVVDWNEGKLENGQSENLNPNEIPLNGLDEQATQSSNAEATTLVRNDDEIDLDLDDDEEEDSKPSVSTLTTTQTHSDLHATPDQVPDDIRAQLPASFSKSTYASPQLPALLPPPPGNTNKKTYFLALDKCLQNRQFLQILDIDPISHSEVNDNTAFPPQLSYDKEWLAIERVFAREGNPTERSSPTQAFPHDKGEARYAVLIAAEQEWLEENLFQGGSLFISENFEPTAPVYNPSISIQTKEQPREVTNPQTSAFCDMIGIPNHFASSEAEIEERIKRGPKEIEDRGWRGRGGGSGGRWGRDRGGRFGRGRGRARGRGAG